ncbi:hypothetical protein P4S72_27580 [Vibrio sp. PP-XX7]
MNLSILWLLTRRFSTALLTLFLVSIDRFSITSVLPGDAAQQILGQFATPGQSRSVARTTGTQPAGN